MSDWQIVVGNIGMVIAVPAAATIVAAGIAIVSLIVSGSFRARQTDGWDARLAVENRTIDRLVRACIVMLASMVPLIAAWILLKTATL